MSIFGMGLLNKSICKLYKSDLLEIAELIILTAVCKNMRLHLCDFFYKKHLEKNI